VIIKKQAIQNKISRFRPLLFMADVYPVGKIPLNYRLTHCCNIRGPMPQYTDAGWLRLAVIVVYNCPEDQRIHGLHWTFLVRLLLRFCNNYNISIIRVCATASEGTLNFVFNVSIFG